MSNASSTKRAQAIAQGFRQLAGPQKRDLQKVLGQTAVAQAQLGIRASRTPYGNPFEALKTRVGKPLQRTGNNIQRSWTAGQEAPTSFRFGNRFKWLMTHQRGAVITPVRARWLQFRTELFGWVKAKKVVIPKRQMVPEELTGGLGKIWTQAFTRTAERYVLKLFRGAR